MDDIVTVLFVITLVLAIALLAHKGYKMVTCPVCGEWMEIITKEGVERKLEEHGIPVAHRIESVSGTKCPNGCWISMSISFREKDPPSQEDDDNEQRWHVRRNEREDWG